MTDIPGAIYTTTDMDAGDWQLFEWIDTEVKSSNWGIQVFSDGRWCHLMDDGGLVYYPDKKVAQSLVNEHNASRK